MLIARPIAMSLAAVLLLAGSALAEEKKKDRATKDDYTIDVSGSSAAVKVGSKGVIKIVIKPKNETKIHPQAPLEISLTQPAGLVVEKKKLGRKDVKDKKAKAPELGCGVTGEKAGDYSVDADVSFFLCTESFCQRMTDRVSIAVKVEANE